jgi:simple sugar transport system permease protein
VGIRQDRARRLGAAMSAIEAPMPQFAAVEQARKRQTTAVGWLLIALAVLVATVFGWGSDGTATFRLTAAGGISVPNLAIPAAPYAYVVALILAFLGARQFMAGAARWTGLLLGIGLFLAVTAFLTWVTAGKSFSLVGMLQATVIRAVPIALGGLSGVLCERVAVVNIAIEGMLLAGAFTGTIAGSLAGGTVGLLAAIAIGGLLGLLLAALVVTYRVDQIIAGVAINLLILGFTSYVSSQVLTKLTSLNNAPVFAPIDIPFIGDIPVIGPVLFQQNLFVYGAAILIALSTYYLFHTRAGLRARAVGEHPEAADTVGINVYRTRYINVILGGLVAGFAGASFTLGAVGRFDEDISGGRGFIGLAAMIFGRWHPVGALAAALVFGFADSLQQKLAILQTPIPPEFLAMAPYLATIVLVAGIIGRARAPAADGKPYIKE